MVLHFAESVVVEHLAGRGTSFRIIAKTILSLVDALLAGILNCTRCVESVINTASDKSHFFA